MKTKIVQVSTAWWRSVLRPTYALRVRIEGIRRVAGRDRQAVGGAEEDDFLRFDIDALTPSSFISKTPNGTVSLLC